MADGGNSGNEKEDLTQQNCSAGVHVFDLKYPTGTTAEELRYLVTENVVKFLGNPTCNDRNRQETAGGLKKEEKNVPESSHRFLDLSDNNNYVILSALNRNHLCLLLKNGRVLRVPCKEIESRNRHYENNQRQSPSSATVIGAATNEFPEQIPFQVASDESYARTLQRTLNTNNIGHRRSYLSRSPVQSYNSATATLSPHNRRELLHASIVFNPALQRLTPAIRGRYVPYESIGRSPPRRRSHIQMGNLPLTSRALTALYTATGEDDLSGSSLHLTDHQQVGFLDNITIVSLENPNATSDHPSGLNERDMRLAAAYSDVLPPLTSAMNMDSDESNVDVMSQDASFVDPSVPVPVIFGTNSSEFESVSMVDNNDSSNSNDSMRFSVNSMLDDSAEKPGPSSKKVSQESSQESMKRTSSPQMTANTTSRSSPVNQTTEADMNIASNLSWLPEMGEISESNVLNDKVVTSIHAMESAFYLIDSDGTLWVWFNNKEEPEVASFDWNGKERITLMGCNMYRATVFFQSKRCSTFYDKCFSEKGNGKNPSLIKSLSHEPRMFSEFSNDNVIDIQCSTFFTAVHTATEKSFWWGLAPSSERNPVNHSHTKTNESTELRIGDTVSLSKQDKNENGSLVFNNILSQFGIVLGLMHQESNSGNPNANKIKVQCFHDSSSSENSNFTAFQQVWDTKDVVFLQDQHSFTGKVVSLDGPYAIVQHNDHEKSEQENLKVYFKSLLEKVECENDLKVGRNRYQKYLCSSPIQVFPNNKFTILAVSATELGINLLVKRKLDEKAFIIYPSCLNNPYSTWFTCGKKELEPNENLSSESNRTIEYEATPSFESNLNLCTYKDSKQSMFDMNSNSCLKNTPYEDVFNSNELEENIVSGATSLTELDDLLQNQQRYPKYSRSVSMPAAAPCSDEKIRGKRKLNGNNTSTENVEKLNRISKPNLVSVGNSSNQMTLLFDNKSCLYPIRFSCCLANPPLLEIMPMKSFVMLDRGISYSKDEKILTVIAIPKVTPLTLAIRNGYKSNIERLVGGRKSAPNKQDVQSPKRKIMKVESEVEDNLDSFAEDFLDEYCSGNQNIMHVAVANIIKTSSKNAPIFGNIMETRNEEENAILQQLLDKPNIWGKIKTLLCQRDSHGCTPFMSAIMVQNLRGAYLILEAVKRNGRNECKVTVPTDKDLFRKAICVPTFSGLTPLHALIHSSSKKNASQQWYNTLRISNLPPSYSARLLLKLFKSQYPSVYRAIMPVPKPTWPQRSIRERLKSTDKKRTTDASVPSSASSSSSKLGKLRIRMNTPQRSTYIDLGARAAGLPMGGRYRADILRANAKEGLVMFGSTNEMYQALSEMNNYSLLTKNDHSSGALLSVVQHLLHVQQYQETYNNETSSPHASSVKNIYVNPIQSSSVGSSSTDYIVSPQMGMQMGTSPRPPGAQNTPTEPSHTREDTISKCFDDIMVHLLITSLVNADPTLAAFGNPEGDSALGYFIKSYPRYSPSHLHKLYLNWRPCNRTNCKYNRHVGNLSITCQNEIESHGGNERNTQKDELLRSATPPNRPGSSRTENPILARRGLQYRGNSLVLNVRNQGSAADTGSPITPSIRILDNLKFTPIEVAANTGLTPQKSHPYSAVEDPNMDGNMQQKSSYSPFFPQVISNESPKKNAACSSSDSERIVCTCHLSKARLLWNTTFEASVFYLAKSWPCIVGTLMHFKPLKQEESTQKTFSLVESSQLDTFTENLLLNPYSILPEVFVKSLMDKFCRSKLSRNQYLLSLLHHENPTNEVLFKGRMQVSLLPWLCIQRFVRSLVRQLSLNLSKNATSDINLKYKIGRYANKTHSKKEARLKENLSLCLRAFSWISVIEILRAADSMLKPIRSGTVKAQAKGIIRDMHNAGPSTGRASLPTGIRMHIPASGINMNQRTFIRNASRRPTVTPPEIPIAGNSMLQTEDFSGPSSSSSSSSASQPPSSFPHYQRQTEEDSSSDNDENSYLDDPYMTETSNRGDRSDIDLNAVDWNQSQGITPSSSVAWAVDGHIRGRTEMNSRLFPPPGLWQFNQQTQLQQQILNTPSIHAGYLYLARMFCRLVKEAVDLACSLRKNKGQVYGPSQGAFLVDPLPLEKNVEEMFMHDAQKLLDNSWAWMKTVLDTLEQQLGVGEQFDTKHYVLRLRKTGQEGDIPGIGRPAIVHKYGSTPDEYMMYLLKQSMGEAENSLPVLDLFSYTHMTYILDAYLYMNKKKPLDIKEAEEQPDLSNKSLNQVEAANQNFFKATVNINNSFEDDDSNYESFKTHVEHVKSLANHIPLWFDDSMSKRCNVIQAEDGGTGEWSRVIEAFSTLFLTEGPGYERDSFLAVKAGASGRMSRFKRSLAAIRGVDPTNRPYSLANNQGENQALLISVVRSKLQDDCISVFSEKMDNHPYGSLRVRFEGEEGTGPGVNRGLFASFATSLKTGEKYKQWPIEFFAECGNLPAQRGIFSPRPGKYNLVEPPTVYFGHPMSKEKRYNAFVAIGRFFGLTLWFNQNIPLVLSRPVLMYLLGQEDQITFDDLAYFDTALYQAFSSMLADALNKTDTIDDILRFEITVDGHTEELIPGGSEIPVTVNNTCEYIRLYTKHLLITCRENELQGLRDGLLFIIPKELLDNLEPEDLQLLLSGGVEDVGLNRLKSIISFSNSRGCSREVLERYKIWFWKIVTKMTSIERQKLLYFATGSSVLPAFDNRVGNNEELSITVDIINSTNNSALPMSSTCGQRISMPLYTTKAMLKQKLLQAIECQSYGLG